jgi:hypothetical protein
VLFYSLSYNSGRREEKELCLDTRLRLGAIGPRLRDEPEDTLNICLLKKKTLASFAFTRNTRRFALNDSPD